MIIYFISTSRTNSTILLKNLYQLIKAYAIISTDERMKKMYKIELH